jgi:hypothetical protein
MVPLKDLPLNLRHARRDEHHPQPSKVHGNPAPLYYYDQLPTPPSGRKRPFHVYRDAILFGQRSRKQYQVPFHEIKNELKEVWNDLIGPEMLSWDEVHPLLEIIYTSDPIPTYSR